MFTTFQECDGVAKPKEGKENNDETGDDNKDKLGLNWAKLSSNWN